MKKIYYIVQEFWGSETFRYVFAQREAAVVAQLLLEPVAVVQEIEVALSEVQRMREAVRYACKELKDVCHRTVVNGQTIDIPILSVNYYNQYFTGGN